MSGFLPQLSTVKRSFSEQACYINYLPSETLTQVFSYLSSQELVACVRTCGRWREIINNSEPIWRDLCRTLIDSFANIESDRHSGYSWKDTYQRHYGANGLKQLWKQGIFSHPKSYQELINKPFCHLDTDSWGQILEWELDRP